MSRVRSEGIHSCRHRPLSPARGGEDARASAGAGEGETASFDAQCPEICRVRHTATATRRVRNAKCHVADAMRRVQNPERGRPNPENEVRQPARRVRNAERRVQNARRHAASAMCRLRNAACGTSNPVHRVRQPREPRSERDVSRIERGTSSPERGTSRSEPVTPPREPVTPSDGRGISHSDPDTSGPQRGGLRAVLDARRPRHRHGGSVVVGWASAHHRHASRPRCVAESIPFDAIRYPATAGQGPTYVAGKKESGPKPAFFGSPVVRQISTC
ncbi:hypothetical protein J2X02_001229 [Pseudoxanthomonas japonensis]|nr:hypothetical protein [Pseudoxanthomonas japonensis]